MKIDTGEIEIATDDTGRVKMSVPLMLEREDYEAGRVTCHYCGSAFAWPPTWCICPQAQRDKTARERKGE